MSNITVPRALLQQALEALWLWMDADSSHTEQHAAYHALKAALAQQEQEPSVCARCGGLVYDPVWVAQSDPPRREWRGLTEEEVNALWASHDKTGEQITRAIEAALKERNT